MIRLMGTLNEFYIRDILKFAICEMTFLFFYFIVFLFCFVLVMF